MENIIDIHTCRECEAGYYCVNSFKTACANTVSNAPAGASRCTCSPGYVLIRPSAPSRPDEEPAASGAVVCGPCPPNSVCPGGDSVSISCSAPPPTAQLPLSHMETLQGGGWSSYCPCIAGQIRSTPNLTCVPCPENFFCPGFANMTGVDPTLTIYAERCPEGAVSAMGSVSQSECRCGQGFYIQTQTDPAGVCSACGIGFYCDNSGTPVRSQCPFATSTTSETATDVRGCVCRSENMTLSQATPPQCVCKKEIGRASCRERV